MHAGGATPITVNQQAGSGQWNSLGTYTFTAGGAVKLTDQANGYVIADAIKVVPTPGQGGTGGTPALHYVYPDHLGTPRVVANAANQPVWRWDNVEPFGDTPPQENPSGLGAFEFPLRFPGQYQDRETGLSYNYFRDYDAAVGRYVQSDPIGLDGGINPYAYVAGNPLAYTDPYGLWAPPSLPGWVVDYSAGFGDTLSFGVTDCVRDQMGTNAVVDRCSTSYGSGKWSGVGLGLAMGGTGIVRGGLRFELGNWKQGGEWFFREGARGPHFHFGAGPGLQSHHLPWQVANWTKNLWSLIKRGEAAQELSNLAAVGYGSAVGVSGAAVGGCGCER